MNSFRSKFSSDNLKPAPSTYSGQRLIEGSAIENLKWLGLSVIAFVLVLAGAVAEAQQRGNIPRIAYAGAGLRGVRIEALRQGLSTLGWVERKNIIIEERYLEGKLERSAEIAAELVRQKFDIIVWSAGSQGLKDIKTIPVVYVATTDLMSSGLVKSLAHPGGNITGLTSLAPELGGKRLELLKETVTKLSRVTFLFNPTSRSNVVELEELRRAAAALRLTLRAVEARDADEIESAFSKMIRERAEALTTGAGPVNNTNRIRIVEMVAKRRLPATYHESQFVDEGGLMSYGTNVADMFRRAATYVDKILKGRTPADLPIEQPMKFEFVVNLKTAKRIGLTIPQWTLMKADKVIK